jgi:uncharacterized pyridoxal phosphate-containing UPF0001 family protein
MSGLTLEQCKTMHLRGLLTIAYGDPSEAERRKAAEAVHARYKEIMDYSTKVAAKVSAETYGLCWELIAAIENGEEPWRSTFRPE